MKKLLYRSEKNKIIGGVCGGLGEYFNIDPSIVRIVFALAFFTEGFGLLLYVILWIILPSYSSIDKDSSDVINENKEEIKATVVKTAKGLKTEIKSDTKKYIEGNCQDEEYVEKYKNLGDFTNFFFKKTIYRVKKND